MHGFENDLAQFQGNVVVDLVRWDDLSLAGEPCQLERVPVEVRQASGQAFVHEDAE